MNISRKQIFSVAAFILVLCGVLTAASNIESSSTYKACLAAGDHRQFTKFFGEDAQGQLVYGPDYLTEESIVFDIGGYTGEADQVFWDKYHPNMYVFEPVTTYYEGLKRRFGHLPKIRLFEYAIGSEDKQMAIRITGDSSTVVPLEQRTADDQLITMRTLDHVFRDHSIDKVDLLYINCEGCEYPILDYIISQGHITRFKNVMVQFHPRPQSVENRCRIRELLSRTHYNTWTYAFVWENWHLKTWQMPDDYRAKLAIFTGQTPHDALTTTHSQQTQSQATAPATTTAATTTTTSSSSSSSSSSSDYIGFNVFTTWLAVLIGVCIAVVYQSYRSEDSVTGSGAAAGFADASFRKFQVTYIAIFLLMTAADWLQGPYVYALYRQYGFSIEDIGLLFVAGFGSSMIFGTVVASIADKVGRKKLCLMYCVLYTLACLTKHSPQFEVLLLGRFFGGIATSILFSAFEAWMVDEHARFGFRSEWLSSTFFYAHFANSIVAILSGIVAGAATDYTGKATMPFDIAIVCLLIGGVLIAYHWRENFGSTNTNTAATTMDPSELFRRAIHTLRNDGKVLCVGLAQGFFEASMYIFVFMWTPVLEKHYPEQLPHGTVFASFMVACMIGSAAFNWLTRNRSVKPETTLVYIFAVSVVCMIVAMLFQATSGTMVLVSFFWFEGCVGAFWPSIGTLRSGLIPEDIRATTLTFFRLPANFIVLVSLNKIKVIPVPMVFALCATMLLVSLFAQLRLRNLLAHTASSNVGNSNKP